jgi:hypothetical protein
LRRTTFRTGAVTIIQRFGSAANLNIHFHCLALEGAYRVGADGRPRFVAVAAAAPAQLHGLLAAMIARLMRLFVRRGAVVAEPDRAWLANAQDRDDDEDMAAADGASALPILHLASTTYRIASGPHAAAASRGSRRLPRRGSGRGQAALRQDRRLQPACGDALPGR